MQWSEVIADKTLQNLPYKIELNERGKIELSPASNKHGYYESEIAFILKSQLPEGKVVTECSIETLKGVKVADVAWCSAKFIARHGFATPYTEAPEICVEIVSPSNNKQEMEEKIKLYLEAGAREVWLVSEDGKVAFHDPSGAITQSKFKVRVAL